MLFCLGASVPKEDEYHFLSEEDENDDNLVHVDSSLIVDLDQESHENCINAGLLQVAVAAAVGKHQSSKSSTSSHHHKIQLSRKQKAHRTFIRKCYSQTANHLHPNTVAVAKFVDTNFSNITTTSINTHSTTSSSVTLPNNNIVGLQDTLIANNHNFVTNSSANSTGSTLLSKLGPSQLGKKLSQLRSKGTEHLQQEALRKSNELGSVEQFQRYIRLPTSSHLKKFSQTTNQVKNSNECSNNGNGSVKKNESVNNQTSSNSCEQTNSSINPLIDPLKKIENTKLSTPSSEVLHSSSPLLPSPRLFLQPREDQPNSSCFCSVSPDRSCGCLSSISTPPLSSSAPPTLVPRSANNPPPRPKTDKPNKSNMSSSASTGVAGSLAKTSILSSSSLANSSKIMSAAALITDVDSSNSHINLNNVGTSTLGSLRPATTSFSSSSSAIKTSTIQHQLKPNLVSTTIQSATESNQAETSFTSNSVFQCGVNTTGSSNSTISALSTSSCVGSLTSNSNNNSNSSSNNNHSHHHQHQQFINKPPRGWLHSDNKLTDSSQGVTYTVRYIGCLGVNTSMKALDFQTRSLIAKESINRVCEAAGLKTADKKRRIDKRIAGMLADSPNMEHAGVDANLSITISYLTLTLADTGEPLAKHEMPNISFASGGDTDTLDFAAYVAKDSRFDRACFVLECEDGRAQEVITTIGQAFELRFNEFLKRNPLSSERLDSNINHFNNNNQTNQSTLQRIDDREYYNDLPGKIPPDIINLNGKDNLNVLNSSNDTKVIPLVSPRNKNNKSLNNDSLDDIQPSNTNTLINLIDLNDDNCTDNSLMIHHGSNNCLTTSNSCQFPKITSNNHNDPHYVNCTSEVTNEVKDPFDMQPFNNALAVHVSSSSPNTSLPSIINQNTNHLEYVPNSDLSSEEWFHGPISRKESETLVIKDGDFLVRESQASPGQYVLTGMQGGCRKHLLLVDPEGIVRTKDKTFECVSHLINYHRNNGLPIISSESALVLKYPILAPKVHF